MNDFTALGEELRRIRDTYSGKCTYALTDISSGEHIGYGEDDLMPTASLIKGPIRSGPDQAVGLVRDMPDDGTVFAAAAGLVHSAALARLRPNLTTPVGLLALGSRKRAFHPGQGTELIRFMARMLECCVHGWREKPA